MAVRLQHVRDNYAVERRLRPIYDLLDCGSNKKALQEVEKVLKKWPCLQCARALKSLATLRLGREKDALTLLDALAADLPTDDSTLLVMTIVYRETHQLEKVCRMYEAAVKKEPTSEELYTHLFMAHVRVADLEKQHHTAMALYRLKSKNPYYFWGVMSVVLQATKGVGSTDVMKRKVYLTLAQRMVDKFINENKLEAEQEVQLYIMILKLQLKYSEALEFLEGPVGRKLMPCALPQASLPFLVSLEDWTKINLLCKELLWNDPDRWDYYLLYFQSSFKLMHDNKNPLLIIDYNTKFSKSSMNEILEHVDDTSEKCHEFLSQIIENGKEKKLRGPFLARLELYKRLKEENKNPEELMGNSADLLVEYFCKFGHKACSVSDLRPYISLVDENNCDALAQRFMDTVGISSVSLPQDDEQMQRHICSLQLGRICGRQALLAEEHARVLASTLALHCERAALCPPRSPTERAPYDPYSLLAAHLCYDLALKCSNSKSLIEALCLLEYVLENSPSNFHCKLLCIKFYHMLGCGNGAHSIYDSLDVKHVQLDSLGYIHVALLGSTALYDVAGAAYETTHKFFSHTFKDSVDHLTFSYKYGSFMKLEELMDWRERLHGSFQRAMVLVEKTFLSFVTSSSHSAAVRSLSQASLTSLENNIDWDNLRDNRDLGVFTNWDPLTIEDKDMPLKQFNQDKHYIRLKFLLLQCLIHCVNIATYAAEKTDTDYTEEIDILDNSKKLFEKYVEDVKNEKLEAVNQISVTSPLPSRIIGLINSSMPFTETCCNAFTLVTIFAKNNFESVIKVVEECKVNLDKCLNFTCDMLDRQISSEDPLWICRETLETLVNFVEIMCVVGVVAGVCCDLIKQSNSKKVKKKIANNAVHVDCGPSEQVASLLDLITNSINRLTYKLDSWNHPDCPKSLSDYFSNLSIVIDNSNIVTVKLKESHLKSLNSLRAILKDKQKYISSIIV